MSKKYTRNYVKEITELCSKGLKAKEIAEKLGFSVVSIRSFKKKYEIEIAYPKISNYQYSLIIGSICGDATLVKQPCSRYPEFMCQHGPKQYQYLKWKATKLESLNCFYKEYVRNKPNKKTGKIYSYGLIRTTTNKNLVELINQFYVERKKRITKDILKYYDELSLAVHYMDDGHLYRGRTQSLATMCFDDESLLLLQNHLYEKWGIESSITKSKRLTVKARSAQLFNSLIKPYVSEIPEMTYKLINVSKLREFKESPEVGNIEPSLF